MPKRKLQLMPTIVLLTALLSACSQVQQTPTSYPVTVQPTRVASGGTSAAPTTGSANDAASTFGPVVIGSPGIPASPTPLPPTAIPLNNGPTVSYGPVVNPNDTPFPTFTPVPPTLNPVAGPTATFGSVIGPNYVSPATFTPAPPPTLPPPENVTLAPPVTAGPSPTPGPILRSDLMGVQIHPHLTNEQWDQMLDSARGLGVGWIKVQLSWKELEDAQGNFNQDYQAQVLDVQRAGSRHLKVLLSFAKAPDWARPAGVRGQEDGPPDDPQAFADFITRFLHDVKPESVHAIEIWNEPNLIREWRGKPMNGAEYMKYFNAAYAAILQAQRDQPPMFDPNHRIIVVTAGPAPTITSAETVNDRGWIQQLYNNGLAKFGDDVVLGAHPYGWANPPDALCCMPQSGVTGWYADPSFYFRNTVDDYRKIMQRNGDGNRKLWITEFGWATYQGLRRSDGGAGAVQQGSGWEMLLDQNQQASYVLRAFYLAQQPPYYDFLGPMMLWNLNFAAIPTMVDNSREEAGFSLLDASGNARPVYLTLRDAPKQ